MNLRTSDHLIINCTHADTYVQIHTHTCGQKKYYIITLWMCTHIIVILKVKCISSVKIDSYTVTLIQDITFAIC